MASKGPQMVRLFRSPLSRTTGDKLAGIFLYKMALQDKPYMNKPVLDEETETEFWVVEKQWYLKFKEEFKKFGWLPADRWNKHKNQSIIMEKY